MEAASKRRSSLMAASGAGGLDAILDDRRKKARDLASRGWPSYPNGLAPKQTTDDVRAAAGALPSDPTDTDPRFSIGGRLKSARRVGKMMFCDLWDRKGRLQIQIRKDLVGDETFEKAKLLDIGDIVLV